MEAIIIYVVIAIVASVFGNFKKKLQEEESRRRNPFPGNPPAPQRRAEPQQRTQPQEPMRRPASTQRTPVSERPPIQGRSQTMRAGEQRQATQAPQRPTTANPTSMQRQQPQAQPKQPPVIPRPLDLGKMLTGDLRELERPLQELRRLAEGRQELPAAPQYTPETSRELEVVHETNRAQEFWNNPESAHKTETVPITKSGKVTPVQMTPNALAQGIIMAEVLQPPRGRRPYRPVYMDRNR